MIKVLIKQRCEAQADRPEAGTVAVEGGACLLGVRLLWG